MTNPRHALPFRPIRADHVLRLAGPRGLCIVAPHPDDETLGCGSLIARAVRRGIRVTVIALTDGDASHPASRRWPPAELGHLRAGETRRALARLGADGARVRRLGWRDGRVGAEARIAQLRLALVASGPGVVLVTSDADHHPDHQAAARLARQAACSLGLPLVHYAVWSRAQAIGAIPGRFHRTKFWAAAAHRSQVDGYIVDDPDGFRLSPADLASLVGSAETFVRAWRAVIPRRYSPDPDAVIRIERASHYGGSDGSNEFPKLIYG